MKYSSYSNCDDFMTFGLFAVKFTDMMKRSLSETFPLCVSKNSRFKAPQKVEPTKIHGKSD